LLKNLLVQVGQVEQLVFKAQQELLEHLEPLALELMDQLEPLDLLEQLAPAVVLLVQLALGCKVPLEQLD
jgi:hypothetical protein